jgi:hypothetical protein
MSKANLWEQQITFYNPDRIAQDELSSSSKNAHCLLPAGAENDVDVVTEAFEDADSAVAAEHCR